MLDGNLKYCVMRKASSTENVGLNGPFTLSLEARSVQNKMKHFW